MQRHALLTRWLLPILAVVILAVVVALAGGFQTARGGVVGPVVQPGEQVDLARWQITVHGVELVNTTALDAPTSTMIRVHMTVTLTGDQSEYSLPNELVTVIPADRSATAVGYQSDPLWQSGLDPDVTRSYVVDYAWPPLDEDGAQPPLPAVPDTATVVIRDEVYTEGPLFGWGWELDDVAAVVPVAVTDNRVES